MKFAYERYPGKSKIYCHGWIITSPQFEGLLATSSIIFIVAVLYTALDIPYLTNNVSIAIPIVFYPCLLFFCGNLAATSFIDPGIIPRKIMPNNTPNHIPVAPISNPVQNPANSDAPPTPYVITYNSQPVIKYNVKGIEIENRYCPTCDIPRPPRSSHCSTCDNCVERFDHRKIFALLSFFFCDLFNP